MSNSDLAAAREIFARKGLKLVVVKEGKTLCESTGGGVRALLDLIGEEGDNLRGASAADSVTGKASALLFAGSGFTSLYTPLISFEAKDVLARFSVSAEYEQEVDYIRNRRLDGRCPFETLVLGIDAPWEALAALRTFFESRS